MRWREKQHSLLTVLTGVTLIVMLIICGLLFWIASQSISKFEDSIINSKRQETENDADFFLKDSESLNFLMYGELSDAELMKLRLYHESGLLNYSYLEQTNMVQKQLGTIAQALPITEKIEIFLCNYQRIISSASLMRYDSETAAWLENVLSGMENGVYRDGDELLFVLSQEMGTQLYRQRMVAVSYFSKSSMMRYLQKFVPADGNSILALYSLSNSGEHEFFMSSAYSLKNELQAKSSEIIATGETGSRQFSSEGTRYLVTWQQIGSLPLKICQITPMDMLTSQLHRYQLMIIVICSGVIALMIALVFFLYNLIRDPIRKMNYALKRVEESDLTVRISPTWSLEYQQIFGQFNQMTEKLEHLIDQEYKLKLLNAKAEMKQMRYQISPHFLYNTYFNMRAMLVDEEYEMAASMSDLMGRYLRYITVSINDDATLKEELDHSLAYMEIQKLRFGKRLTTRVQEFPEWMLSLRIPRIVIQPLIENAFEHGIRHQEKQGIIVLSADTLENAVVIRVDDNGENASDELIASVQGTLNAEDFNPDSDSVALINIHRRISLLYPKGSGLFVSRSPLGGFRSEIRMVGVQKCTE